MLLPSQMYKWKKKGLYFASHAWFHRSWMNLIHWFFILFEQIYKNHMLLVVPVCSFVFSLTTLLEMDIERRMTTLMGRPLKLFTVGCVNTMEAGMALCWCNMAVIIFQSPCQQRNTLCNVKSDHLGAGVTTAANLSRFQYMATHQLQSDPFFTLTEE